MEFDFLLTLCRILEILCRKIKKNIDIDMDLIVTNTPGYVGADLNSLIDEALISSLDRRLLSQINAENASENKEFVTSLIDHIKKKLIDLGSQPPVATEAVKPEESTQSAIEVGQCDFETAIKCGSQHLCMGISSWQFRL